MGIRIAGIQPGYIAWLGFFDQMLKVDAFILADELPFSSSGWVHRNRVLGPHGAHWLTLPGRPQRGQHINQVALDTNVDWHKAHMRTLKHFYAGSPHAHAILDALAEALDPRADRLVDISVASVRFLAERLGITTPILVSSERGLEAEYVTRFPDQPSATHRIIAYMQALGATELLEGESGQDYMNLELCAEHGIRVSFQHYRHPTYRQMRGSFVSHLSSLDLLLCEGSDGARRVLHTAAGESE
jgi:hypothetical protein